MCDERMSVLDTLRSLAIKHIAKVDSNVEIQDEQENDEKSQALEDPRTTILRISGKASRCVCLRRMAEGASISIQVWIYDRKYLASFIIIIIICFISLEILLIDSSPFLSQKNSVHGGV